MQRDEVVENEFVQEIKRKRKIKPNAQYLGDIQDEQVPKKRQKLKKEQSEKNSEIQTQVTHIKQDSYQKKAKKSNNTADKYYKKFDFFYKRTCFRLMAEYYKHLFQPYLKMWIEQKKKLEMADLIQQFAIQYFQGLLNSLAQQEIQELLTLILVLVHSHRHNKEDTFINNLNIDFSIIRDTMYKYSKKAQERYFSYPFFSFFFIYFYKNGSQFIENKFLADKGVEYFQRMWGEIEQLKIEAFNSLNQYQQVQGTNNMVYSILSFVEAQ